MTPESALKFLGDNLHTLFERTPPRPTPQELYAGIVLWQAGKAGDKPFECGEGRMKVHGYSRDAVAMSCPNCDSVRLLKVDDPLAMMVMGAAHGAVLKARHNGS